MNGDPNISWYEQLLRSITERGKALTEQGYTPYPGQRLADFAPEQKQAFDLFGQNLGGYKSGLQQAGQMTQQAATYDPAKLQNFLSPYLSGVTDEIARLGNRNFTENLLPQTMAQFTNAGQWGSSRSQDAAGRAARDVQANILGQQQSALENAYNQAQNAYGNWANRGISGGQQIGALTEQGQKLGSAELDALTKIGQAKQQQQQAGLDVAQQEFNTQRDYPMQQLGQLARLAQGMPLSGLIQATPQQTAPAPSASPFSAAVSGLSGIAGGLMGTQQQQQNVPKYSQGGSVSGLSILGNPQQPQAQTQQFMPRFFKRGGMVRRRVGYLRRGRYE